MIGLILFMASAAFSCGPHERKTGKKVLVLGIDGMDPLLLKEFMAKGEMPNFAKLIAYGDFKPLMSSIPAQSPVAWSNFITGKNPGNHGIYDFIHRDPQTYMPFLSTTRTEDPPEKSAIHLGNRVLWLSGGKVELLRQGKPFWEYLAEKNIYTRVFKIPSNFPPAAGKGWSGSGMGAPDLLGTYGTFTFFTDNPPDRKNHPETIGGGTITPVYPVNNVIRTQLMGPKNIYALDPQRPFDLVTDPETGKEKKLYNYVDAEVPLTIYLDPEHPAAKIEFQDQEVLLGQGEWSGWFPIEFPLWPRVVTVHGIVRFYLKEAPKMVGNEVKGDFKLYASPLNMDPLDPPMPITNPPEYAKTIAEQLGYYYTQGMPENTKARQADLDILNDAEFLDQVMSVHREDLRMFKWHLDHFQDGLLFYYFSSLDLGTHMFWRLHDPRHPAYDPVWAGLLGDPLERIYMLMDQVLGFALNYVDDHTTLIVMSDHGFGPWYYSFEANTFLLDNGYLKLLPGVKPENVEYFSDKNTGQFGVDWSRTLAYSLGINGLYLNLSGREKYGAVAPSEYRGLVDEIAKKLEDYVDPKTGMHPILHAYKSYEVYHGDYTQSAPDIILGFRRPYRGSDNSALGEVPKEIISVNDSSWSGDHCIAPSEVPGILITNQKITKPAPALIDLGPTILKLFGLPAPPDMDGKPVF